MSSSFHDKKLTAWVDIQCSRLGDSKSIGIFETPSALILVIEQHQLIPFELLQALCFIYPADCLG